MKRGIAAILLGLSACGPTGSNPTGSQPASSTVDLLRQGDGQACSREDVRQAVISQVQPKDTDSGPFTELQDFQNGRNLLSFNIDTIALAGIDRSINSVSCDANLIVHYKDHEDKPFSIRFVVRPSVENASEFIINLSAQDAAQYAVNAARDAASNIALSRANAAQARWQQQNEQEQAVQQRQLAGQQQAQASKADDTLPPEPPADTTNHTN
jgi:hypothetical protein